MTLWILFCRMTEKWDTLFTFYARDREHAQRRAEELLREHPYERLELKEYPRGFRMGMLPYQERLKRMQKVHWQVKLLRLLGKKNS